MDQEREAKVWQRVAGQQETRTDLGIRGLIRESGELAAIYRRMGEKLTGQEKQLARKLYEREQSNRACLRGIALLSGIGADSTKPWVPGKGDGKGQLMRCYHRTQHCQAEYMARSLDPEYGCVYRELALRQERQCALLAELLGWLG